MTFSTIDNPSDFFFDLGNLHDAKVRSVNFDETGSTIYIQVSDLFVGIREAEPGSEVPATIAFKDVEDFDIRDKPNHNQTRIMDLEISRANNCDRYNLHISFSPYGNISATFASVSLNRYAA